MAGWMMRVNGPRVTLQALRLKTWNEPLMVIGTMGRPISLANVKAPFLKGDISPV